MKIFRIREGAEIRVNLEILEEVEKEEDYELKKFNPKENMVPPSLKRNFEIYIPRRGDKYYEILTLRGRSRK